MMDKPLTAPNVNAPPSAAKAETVPTNHAAKIGDPDALTMALGYAALGWHVFPTKYRRKAVPACGVKWGTDATRERATIRAWFDQESDAGVSIATGPSRLLVIDVDDAEGWDHLAAIGADLRTIHTPRAKSGRASGEGCHVYLSLPDGVEVKSASAVLPGVDCKSRGGCIQAPPSIHPDSGRPYEWIVSPGEAPLAECPRPLLALLEGALTADELRAWRDHGASQLGLEGMLAALSTVPEPTESESDEPSEPAPPVLGDAALHGLAGQYVAAVRPFTEACDAAVLATFLSYAGCCFGAADESPRLSWGTETHRPASWPILVGTTGHGAKGSSEAPLRILRKLAKPASVPAVATEWESIEAAPAYPAYPSLSPSSGEGMIHAIRDASESPGPKAGTPIIDPGVSDKRLVLLVSEFGGTLAVSKREGNSLTAIMRRLWDGGAAGAMTKRNHATVERPSVVVIGHVTPTELRMKFDADMLANGFANRMLWVHSYRARSLPMPDAMPDAVLHPVVAALQAAVLAAKGRTYTNASFTDAATDYWCGTLEPRLSRKYEGLLDIAAGRSRPYVLRLAMLYALLDESESIELVHLLAAEAVWDYSEASFLRAFGDAGKSATDSDGEKLLRAVNTNGGTATMGELSNVSPTKHWKRDRRRATVDRLVRAGKLELLPRNPTAGRHADSYKAVR